MSLVVDGYNLLFTAGMELRHLGPGTLERARHALLRFLAESLTMKERQETVVVFDAKEAPPGAEAERWHDGIRVLFAREYDEADELIEELIYSDSVPHRLVLVTSDLRLQRAARRRRAQVVSSDDWLDALEWRQRERREEERRRGDAVTEPMPSPRRIGLDRDEVDHWLAEFEISHDVSSPEAEASAPAIEDPSKPAPSPPPPAPESASADGARRSHEDATHSEATRSEADFDWGPFPPGYGDDLWPGA